MKITKYMGAFAVIAMLAACSTDDELHVVEQHKY